MTNYFYSEINNETLLTPNQNGYSNTDNEKRKLLSIETNRRRRDMAIRIKRQIEKEEERRKEILRQRREYHENLTNKMRRTRHNKASKLQNSNQSKPWSLDETLNMIRHNSSSSVINCKSDRDHQHPSYKTVLESAWSDSREGYLSPMAKYAGSNSGVKNRTTDFYLKTFETKLIAHEQSFKEKQNHEMLEFSRILDDTVDKMQKENNNISYRDLEQSATFRIDSQLNNIKDPGKSASVSNLDIEDILDDSLNDSSDEAIESHYNDKYSKVEPKELETPSAIQTTTTTNIHSNIKTTPIKSILKKDIHSKFTSNPDLSGILPRDSVEVTRIKSARIKRSNSFSQGINYIINRPSEEDKIGFEDDNGRKIVRFAEDHNFTKKENIAINPEELDPIISHARVPETPKPQINPKLQKPPVIPSSTPLKPPLHPRSIQEGSYLHTITKKTPVFHPPPKPRKISAEVLDNEIGTIIGQKKPQRSPSGVSTVSDTVQQGELMIPLDKTPTEREIDQLWAEVRECLSRKQNPSKTGSVGTPAGVSVRTVDSGSGSSVWSAPAWQRNVRKAPPFQVRHHGSITPKQNIYQGQEPPMKDLVIVHSAHEPHNHSGVIQQPLSVLSRQDQGFQQVSESLEEFLVTENACNISQTPRNVFLPHPPSLNRPRIRPQIKGKLFVPPTSAGIPNSQSSSNVHKSQLSLDEENIKMSLDRLNERLKSKVLSMKAYL